MRKTIKRIWNLLLWALIGVVVLLAILLVGVKAAGLQVFTVLSGSMEPVYHTGSVIYVRQVDPAELEAGDVITFHLSGTTVATHRITEVIGEGDQLQFRTKGDANDVEDGSPVDASAVIGTPVFTIPGLGYLAMYIQTPFGRFAGLAAGALILLMLILPDLLFPEEKKENKEPSNIQQEGTTNG